MPTSFYVTIVCVVVLSIQFYVNHCIFSDLESEKLHKKQKEINDLIAVNRVLENEIVYLKEQINVHKICRDGLVDVLRGRLDGLVTK